MKLVLKNIDKLDPNYFKPEDIGKELEVKSFFGNTYTTVNEDGTPGAYLTLDNCEKPSERFARLMKTATRVIISGKTKGYSVDLLQTEHYLVMYSHSKGNHWNIFGNHYKYYHDIDTGEFIPDNLVKYSSEPYLIKQKMLKAELQQLQKIKDSYGSKL
jgi:hypothetical protein